MNGLRNKRNGNAGDGYDYWITATELMSAVMLVFILLGLVAMLRAKDEESKRSGADTALAVAKREIAEVRRSAAADLAQCRSEVGTMESCDADLKKCRGDYAALLSTNEACAKLGEKQRKIDDSIRSIAGALGVEMEVSSNSVRLDANLLFPTGSDSLSQEGETALLALIPKYAEVILMSEVKDSVRRVMIEGHSSRLGGDLLNMRLSTTRALRIYEYLTSKLPPFPEREEFLKLLTPAGRGELDATGGPDSDLPSDRTVELRIEFFVPVSSAELPAPLGGKLQ